MMKFKYLTSIFLLLFSCGNRKQENVKALLQIWSGKEVLFPTNSVFTVKGKDTVDFSILEKFKILTYVDSVGCVSCKLQLSRWKELMEEIDSMEMDSVRFLFFFSPEKRRNFLGTLRSENFTYPVCIDDKNKLNELNHFPSDASFHTFLLDKDNKVLAIGDPIHNPKVKELYLKIIQGGKIGRRDENKVVRTKVSMEKTSVSLDSFDWQEEQKATFTLKNTGNHPLVIEYVNTSCGCTTVDYPKEPVRPGNSISLTVTYKADKPEHFNKTITVYCNAEASPIRLSVSGNAK